MYRLLFSIRFLSSSFFCFLTNNYPQLQDQIGPLKSKIRAKEAEKQRLRTQGNEEERNLQTLASQFDNDIKRLDYLVRQIDAFLESSKSDELEELSSTIAKTVSRIEERKQRMLEVKPELDAARAAVLDQERHKNQLRQNIDILEAKMRLSKLENEINRLELKRDSIDGHETAHDDYVTLKSSKDKLNEDKARLDGRFSEIAESIRSLKVSAKTRFCLSFRYLHRSYLNLFFSQMQA